MTTTRTKNTFSQMWLQRKQSKSLLKGTTTQNLILSEKNYKLPKLSTLPTRILVKSGKFPRMIQLVQPQDNTILQLPSKRLSGSSSHLPSGGVSKEYAYSNKLPRAKQKSRE
jgi:hypothetical protein